MKINRAMPNQTEVIRGEIQDLLDPVERLRRGFFVGRWWSRQDRSARRRVTP